MIDKQGVRKIGEGVTQSSVSATYSEYGTVLTLIVPKEDSVGQVGRITVFVHVQHVGMSIYRCTVLSLGKRI